MNKENNEVRTQRAIVISNTEVVSSHGTGRRKLGSNEFMICREGTFNCQPELITLLPITFKTREEAERMARCVSVTTEAEYAPVECEDIFDEPVKKDDNIETFEVVQSNLPLDQYLFGEDLKEDNKPKEEILELTEEMRVKDEVRWYCDNCERHFTLSTKIANPDTDHPSCPDSDCKKNMLINVDENGELF